MIWKVRRPHLVSSAPIAAVTATCTSHISRQMSHHPRRARRWPRDGLAAPHGRRIERAAIVDALCGRGRRRGVLNPPTGREDSLDGEPSTTQASLITQQSPAHYDEDRTLRDVRDVAHDGRGVGPVDEPGPAGSTTMDDAAEEAPPSAALFLREGRSTDLCTSYLRRKRDALRIT